MNVIKNNRRYLLFGLFVLLAMFALSNWAWINIPDDVQIPTHFGPDGQPDDYGGKFEGLLLLPLVSGAILTLLLFVPRIEPRRSNILRSGKAYGAFRVAIMLFFLALHTSIVLTVLGYNVPLNSVLSVTVGILFMVIGNYMGKIRSTFTFGIRTPWTLSSDLSWNKTHRLGGKLFMLSGLAILVCGLFAPNLLFPVLLIAPLGTVGVTLIYSYTVWKGDPEAQR